MFCLVLRNALTIKSLFLGSVIFRNDMFFISHLFLFFFSNTVLNMILNTILNTVLKMVLNTFWTWFWSWDQVEEVVEFRLNNTLASVSILPVFSRLASDFILRSYFIRVNVSNSSKISEYSSSEKVSSDNAFEMRLLIVLSLSVKTA